MALFLIALKVASPDKVFMLRGNHETANQTAACGFKVGGVDGWSAVSARSGLGSRG